MAPGAYAHRPAAAEGGDAVSKQRILYTDDSIARRVTVTGWADRNGHFWGDSEHMARWSSCTHVVCACGAEVEKHWLACRACRDKQSEERWQRLPLVEWDGKTPLCVHDGDRFFFDADDLYDWCDANSLRPSEMRLVLCEPRHFSQVSVDHWADELPEDGELPGNIQAALDALNAVIDAHQGPAAWYPSDQRVVMPDRDQPAAPSADACGAS